MKLCNKCEVKKSPSEFYPRDNACKECRKERVRANRAANIEYYREYDRNRSMRPDRVEARIKYQETEAGKKAVERAKRKWTEKNPVKRAATYIVNNAIRDGRLRKPAHCSKCKKAGRIEGHHPDYAKPLEVIWLCSGCHTEWHKENGEGINS